VRRREVRAGDGAFAARVSREYDPRVTTATAAGTLGPELRPTRLELTERLRQEVPTTEGRLPPRLVEN
jgi:hypothetical protein